MASAGGNIMNVISGAEMLLKDKEAKIVHIVDDAGRGAWNPFNFRDSPAVDGHEFATFGASCAIL
jgi:hypothetical protein